MSPEHMLVFSPSEVRTASASANIFVSPSTLHPKFKDLTVVVCSIFVEMQRYTVAVTSEPNPFGNPAIIERHFQRRTPDGAVSKVRRVL